MFERRLIEKYIAENGVDPVTNEVLTEDQLIDIQGIPVMVVQELLVSFLLVPLGTPTFESFISGLS